jgi:hypothetical protein
MSIIYEPLKALTRTSVLLDALIRVLRSDMELSLWDISTGIILTGPKMENYFHSETDNTI